MKRQIRRIKKMKWGKIDSDDSGQLSPPTRELSRMTLATNGARDLYNKAIT